MTDDLSLPARALDAARGWIGTPYRHGASCQGAGADCLGLVRGVWAQLTGRPAEAPPPYSPLWAEETGAELLLEALGRHMAVLTLDAAGPGDVVAFRFTPWAPVKHVAVLSAADRMIHAYSGHAVAETAMGPWWRRRRAAAFRFVAVPFSSRLREETAGGAGSGGCMRGHNNQPWASPLHHSPAANGPPLPQAGEESDLDVVSLANAAPRTRRAG